MTVTCSVILWLSTWLRSRILMATWFPFSTSFANLTLAKLPSPMVFPSSYFPKRVRGLTGFPLIFRFLRYLSVWSYETGSINEYESLTCFKYVSVWDDDEDNDEKSGERFVNGLRKKEKRMCLKIACSKRVGKRGPSLGVVVCFGKRRTQQNRIQEYSINHLFLCFSGFACIAHAPSWKLLSSFLSQNTPSFHILHNIISAKYLNTQLKSFPFSVCINRIVCAYNTNKNSMLVFIYYFSDITNKNQFS